MFTSSAKLAKKLLKRNQPGELFPYVDYLSKDQAFITDDGHLGKVWLCMPINGSGKEIESVMNSLLDRKYPDDCFIQAMLFASPDITQYTQGYANMRGGRVKDEEKNKNYSGASRSSIEFWNNATKKPILPNGSKARTFKLYISYKMPIKGTKGILFSPKEMSTFRRFSQVVEGALKNMFLQKA